MIIIITTITSLIISWSPSREAGFVIVVIIAVNLDFGFVYKITYMRGYKPEVTNPQN
jgi:hypothetical protein